MAVENFGYKNAWLAVRATPMAVANVLVMNASPSSWSAGIRAAYAMPNATYGEDVFISPALGEWVLCVGTALAAVGDADPPTFGRLATELARTLGTEVQYFATHRVVEAHAWSKAGPSGVIRAFSYRDGEVLVDEGVRSAVESEVEDPPSEEDVLRVAGAWSIDPSRLEQQFPDAPDGVLGRLAIHAARPHSARVQGSARARPWWKLW